MVERLERAVDPHGLRLPVDRRKDITFLGHPVDRVDAMVVTGMAPLAMVTDP